MQSSSSWKDALIKNELRGVQIIHCTHCLIAASQISKHSWHSFCTQVADLGHFDLVSFINTSGLLGWQLVRRKVITDADISELL